LGQNYPSFQRSYSHEDLVEYFLLTPGELELILKCRGDANRCGMALLLKTLPHLGYVPDLLNDIPPEVREFVAGQIGLLWDCSESYPWHSSTFDHHLAQVRESTGWRFATAADKRRWNSGFSNTGRIRGCLRSSSRCEPVQHQSNRGNINHRLRSLHRVLVVFAKPPVAPEPRKRPLHNPRQARNLERPLSSLDNL
jgi:hypothetical protein